MKFQNYGDAPWVFKGRALYQLQLVPVEEAKKYVPPELNLVSLFGYTLGGFYLARYEDSPVGKFDELVTIAGIVWNPPTSSAWAARVYVNNSEARDHGVWRVGLPSRLVSFTALDSASSAAQQQTQGGLLAVAPNNACPPQQQGGQGRQQPQQQARRPVPALAAASWWAASGAGPVGHGRSPSQHKGSTAGALASTTSGLGSAQGAWPWPGPAHKAHAGGGGSGSSAGDGGYASAGAVGQGTAGGEGSGTQDLVVVDNVEGRKWWAPWSVGPKGLLGPVAHMHMPPPPAGWPGPRIPLTLPSFSGNTPEYPGLLYYACQLATNVRVVRPVTVRVEEQAEGGEESMHAILGGKPVLALAFNNMVMTVDEPEKWAKGQRGAAKKQQQQQKQQLVAQPA